MTKTRWLGAIAFWLCAFAASASARASLVAYYPFNAANPLADLSGNGNTLILPSSPSNQPTYSPTGGFTGGAFQFNGNTRLIAPVNIDPLNAGGMPNMTWGAWVNSNLVSPFLYKVLGQDNGNYDRVIGLDIRGTGGFRFTAFRGPLGSGMIDNSTPYVANQWVFIAATYDQSLHQETLYVETNPYVGGTIQSFTTTTAFDGGQFQFAIGDIRPDFQSEGFQGTIDNVFVYNQTLTATQIATVRDNNGLLPSSPVPEPSSLMLAAVGAGCAVVLKRRRASAGKFLKSSSRETAQNSQPSPTVT